MSTPSPTVWRAALTSRTSCLSSFPSGPQPSLIAVKPTSASPATLARTSSSVSGVGVDAHDQVVLAAIRNRIVDFRLP
jgi:hypothetical protein